MVNGIVYTNFASWVGTYIRETSARNFVPTAICSSPGIGANYYLNMGACFHKCQTGETFISDSLQFFASMSVSMHAMLPPRAGEIQILSNIEPVLVMADPTSTQHGSFPSESGSNSNSNRNRNSNSNSERRSRNTDSKRRMLESRMESSMGALEEETVAVSDSYDTDDTHMMYANARHIAESDVLFYQNALIACMNTYATEDYTSALTSCMSAEIAYIHLQGPYYYMIEPRHPFAVNAEYMQNLPEAQYPQSRGILTSDWLIGSLLLLLVSMGLVLGLRNLKIHEAFTSSSSGGSSIGGHGYGSGRQVKSGAIMDGISMSINSTTASSTWSSSGKSGYRRASTSDEDIEMQLGTHSTNSTANPMLTATNTALTGAAIGAPKNRSRTGSASSDTSIGTTDADQGHRGLHCHVTASTPTVLNVSQSIFENCARNISTLQARSNSRNRGEERGERGERKNRGDR